MAMPKIVTDTPDEIVIEDRPWTLGLVLIGFGLLSVYMVFQGVAERDAFLFIAGLAFTAGIWFALKLGVRRTRLTLRPDGRATLTIRDATGLSQQVFAPGSLRAGLATQTDEGETHRVILLVDTADGLERITLTRYLCSSGSHKEAVDRINAWAQSLQG